MSAFCLLVVSAVILLLRVASAVDYFSPTQQIRFDFNISITLTFLSHDLQLFGNYTAVFGLQHCRYPLKFNRVHIGMNKTNSVWSLKPPHQQAHHPLVITITKLVSRLYTYWCNVHQIFFLVIVYDITWLSTYQGCCMQNTGGYVMRLICFFRWQFFTFSKAFANIMVAPPPLQSNVIVPQPPPATPG